VTQLSNFQVAAGEPSIEFSKLHIKKGITSDPSNKYLAKICTCFVDIASPTSQYRQLQDA
jgi:hypothetical protein